ncbi:prepilin-type N-terminal cleavage/methylation domain-containing protein [Candidatus Saccharibacteria bacterium]|nr:prepilin-type N-terminal cleavage/methylation domain-containing protein [Candidatus Saccharibacteria bacterium]
MMGKTTKQTGFTIVELLIVIVVIGILAAITIVAYNGIQNRSRDVRTQSDIKNTYTVVEKYAALNGSYPSTGGLGIVRTDANCVGGSKQLDWVPGVTEKLPQSNPNTGKGSAGVGGCYMYASDGQQYVISAWNMSNSDPQKTTMYRRLGFREMGFVDANAYLCNHINIGGAAGTYSALNDMYKYSFTISNISTCVETPPAGA